MISWFNGLVLFLTAFAADDKFCCKQSFYQGFDQCRQHAMKYLSEKSGMTSVDPLIVDLNSYLRAHTPKAEPGKQNIKTAQKITNLKRVELFYCCLSLHVTGFSNQGNCMKIFGF